MKSSVFKDQGFDMISKIILVGDSGVGKTSLLLRYIDDVFYQNSMANSTLFVDFKIKDIVSEQGRRLRLQFWDTVGQERYQSINAAYYKGTSAALVVFSLADPVSFSNVKSWVNEVRQYGDGNELIFMVGAQLDKKKQVSISTVKALAKQQNLQYFQLSSRTAEGVQEMFRSLIGTICNNQEAESQFARTTKLTPDFEKPKKSCDC